MTQAKRLRIVIATQLFMILILVLAWGNQRLEIEMLREFHQFDREQIRSMTKQLIRCEDGQHSEAPKGFTKEKP